MAYRPRISRQRHFRHTDFMYTGVSKRVARRVVAALVLAFNSVLSTAMPATASLSVDNFTLLDHRGVAQELYYERDAKAVVIMVHGNGCQIVRSLLTDFKALRDDYAEQGVRVLMLNSNLQDTRASIAKEAAEWGIDIPILHDRAQLVGRSLGLTRTAEVLVIDPRSWQLVYRGALNNRVDYERQKNNASESYVRNVLDQLIAGEGVDYREVRSSGCLINFPALVEDQQISYVDDIAPILQDNCVMCHREGGIAPWAMSEYRMVQGFAPMMREVIRTRRMPPWHVDPEVGQWKHDAGLTDEEASTLVRWIEAGARRGDGEDPLPHVKHSGAEWPLGEPDLVLEVPTFAVPATGEVDYQFPWVENPLDEPVWVVAATVIPGDTQAVHHVLFGSADSAPSEDDYEGVFQNFIMGYAPGNESGFMPEGTGVYVPVGGVYLFQMHYTPYGRATTDTTRVGLYFADKSNPPEKFLRQHVVLNLRLSIPPGAENHVESAYFEFWDDAVLYSLVPHSHYRGKSSRFDLVFPDGERELILSVPNYDFNWQRTYTLAEPKPVPAGTRIVHTTVYDNSPNNVGNPDPGKEVKWGFQSADEMLYGSVAFTWLNESSSNPTHSNAKAEVAQWLGFTDKDMNGRMDRSELHQRLLDGIGWRWVLLDSNFDGGLDLAEAQLMLQGMRSSRQGGSARRLLAQERTWRCLLSVTTLLWSADCVAPLAASWLSYLRSE
ncbi:MAG: redoxin domain-containing protein [Pseudomonadota bacterium]